MTPDTLSPPLPNTLDLSGLPDGVVRQVTAIVEAARREPAAPGPTAGPPDVPSLTPEQRLAAFAAWVRELEGMADRWPPGHVIDDSRETIYGDREREPL